MLLLFKLHNTVHSCARVDAGSEYKKAWAEEGATNYYAIINYSIIYYNKWMKNVTLVIRDYFCKF